MKKRNVMPNNFALLLNQAREKHSEGGKLLTGVECLFEHALYVGICGSWIATEGPLSLLVRRSGEGYSLLLCDNSHCYKSIVREMSASLVGRGLLLLPDGEQVALSEQGLLHCGSYGLFRSEESMLREEMQYEMEFTLRSTMEEGYES